MGQEEESDEEDDDVESANIKVAKANAQKNVVLAQEDDESDSDDTEELKKQLAEKSKQ